MIDPAARLKEVASGLLASRLTDLYRAAAREVADRASLASDPVVLPRWGARVSRVTEESMKRTARQVASALWEELGGEGDPPSSVMDAWLETAAKGRGDGWVKVTNESLRSATREALPSVLEAIVAAAESDAEDATEAAGAFGSFEAAKRGGARTKTWNLGPSRTHRPSHAAQAGLTRPIDGTFPNGQTFPRSGKPEEKVNCNCYLTYGR